MPLRAIIKNSPETLSDVLLAAEDRYLEAEELLVSQRYDGAVYLLGYSVEMWLKASCLRLRGLGPATVVKAALPPLKTWGLTQTVPPIPFGDYHDLSFFAECIIRLRSTQSRPLPPSLMSELQTHVVNGMYAEWIMDMRYRRSAITSSDAWAALSNAWWVKSNWTNLT